MRNFFYIILTALVLGACAGKTTSTDNASASATVVANKTVKLAIEGMTCTGCESTIQEAVTKVAGVTSIKASHLDSIAVVSFDSTKTTLAAIGDAVTKAGYDFKGIKK